MGLTKSENMSVTVNVEKLVLDDNTGGYLTFAARGWNVGDCLDDLVRQYPPFKKALFDDQGELRFDKLYIVNGKYETVNLTGKTIQEGAEIKIIKFRDG
jgi:hypothetical protein